MRVGIYQMAQIAAKEGKLPTRQWAATAGSEVVTMPGSHESRKAKLPPIHPGEILNEEFLRPLGITQYRLAKAIGVDVRRIHAIVHGQRAITAETALLLSRFFQNSAEFWMGLQSQYELELEQDRLAERLAGVSAYRRTHDAHTQAR